MQQGRLDEAERLFRQAIDIDPFEAEAYHRLGMLFLRRGDQDRGEKLLAMFKRIQPVSADIERFRYILNLYPDDTNAHYNLGVLYGGLGRYAEAGVEYAAALHINDQDLSARNNLANVLLRQGRIDEAIHHYEIVLALNPRYAQGFKQSGLGLYDERRFATGRPSFCQGAQASTGQRRYSLQSCPSLQKPRAGCAGRR